MKSICHKVHIHFFFYVVAFLVMITGNVKSFCLFMSLLLVHECGHILAGIFFKWKIEKVYIFPFGALTVFQDHLNRPIREEFIIVLMGPIFQCIFYYILSNFSFSHLASFHYGLLVFNLLPIVPLDGSKIWSLIYQRLFSYWKSFYFIFVISLFVLGYLFCFSKERSLVFFFILLILIHKVITEFQKRYALFSKFTLERIMYSFSFPRRKLIYGRNVKKMKRDVKHIFYIDGNYYTEQVYLRKIFDFKEKK